MRVPMVLLVLALFVLPATAQDGASWSVEDAGGDQEADGDVPFPGATWAASDIVAAAITEGEEVLHVSVTSADLTLTEWPTTPVQGANFIVAFQVGGAGYEARFLQSILDGGWFLILYEQVGEEWVEGPRYDVVRDGDTLRAEVPRDRLSDADGQPLNPLTEVTDIHARSRSLLRPGLGDDTRLSGVGDRAPDEPGQDGSFAPAFGMEQTGPLQVTSPRPFRASNGLATTYAVQVHVTDTRSDGGPVPVSLSVQDPPPDWSVQLLPDTLRSSPGDEHEVVLLLGTPDRHQHGVVESGTLHIEAPSEGWKSVLEFGVSYVDPPLPSGHHPELYTHALYSGTFARIGDQSFFERSRAFLSTAMEDGRAEPGPADMDYGCEDYERQEDMEVCATAIAPLFAGDLGLVREEGPAPVSLEVVWPDNAAPQAADGRARILWASGWDSIDGFHEGTRILWESDWQALDVNSGRSPYEADLAFVDGPMRFEAQDPGTLWLDLQVRSSDPVIQTYSDLLVGDPALAPGGTIRLPLGEYHDAIAEIVGDQAFQIHAPSVVDVARDVATAVQFHVVDVTDSATDVRVEVGGPAAKWVVGEPELVFADGEGTVTLRMLADSGSIGQASSLAVAVHDHATGITGATTVPVQVVESSQVEADEGPSQDTPGLGVLAVLGLLAVALARRR